MEASSTKKFLIDGFPRNEDNLTGWEKQMGDKADIGFVLFFNCPEEVIGVCICTQVKLLKFLCPQVCLDRALKRGRSSGRIDDNPEAFVKRYTTSDVHVLS